MQTNISQNVTIKFESDVGSKLVFILMRFEGSLILFLNAFVLLALSCRREKFSSSYWFQIICLAFNDSMAGIAVILSSFIDSQTVKENITVCSLTVVFLFGSQSASLYNIFGISLYRFIVLRLTNLNSRHWKKRHIVLATTVSWTFSIFVCTLPILLYNKSEKYRESNYCSFQDIFGDDLNKGMLMTMGSFILPLLFTNIVYVTLFCILNSRWKKVSPINEGTSSVIPLSRLYKAQKIEHVESNSNLVCLPNTSIGSNKYKAPSSSNVLLVGEIPCSEICSERDRGKVHQILDIKENDFPTQGNISVQSTSNVALSTGTVPKLKSAPYDKSSRPEQRVTSTISKRQRRAFLLLGIVLLLLNICSWPIIITLLFQSQNTSTTLKRDKLLLLFTTICFNAVLNPVLYTATISEFRSFLFDTLLKLKSFLKC